MHRVLNDDCEGGGVWAQKKHRQADRQTDRQTEMDCILVEVDSSSWDVEYDIPAEEWCSCITDLAIH